MLREPKKKPLLSPPLPDEVKLQYFEALRGTTPIYLCIVSGNSSTPRMYFEKDEQNKVDGIVRVFFSKDDIEIYMDMVADSERVPYTMVKLWETNLTEVVKFLIKLNNSSKNNNKKGIRAVASTIFMNTLTEVDVFWTNETELMV